MAEVACSGHAEPYSCPCCSFQAPAPSPKASLESCLVGLLACRALSLDGKTPAS